MYVQYKINISEKQVDTLKDAIPKDYIKGNHVLLLTPGQIN